MLGQPNRRDPICKTPKHEIAKITTVNIEIVRFFTLFSLKILRKEKLKRYVVDVTASYQKTSKLEDLSKNW